MEKEALAEVRVQREAKAKAAAEAKREEEALRAKEAEEAKLRREAEYKKMMAEYKKEKVQVTDDGAKDETVEVSETKPLEVPAAPVVTVTSDEGMSHSYPKRDFKPEQPKTEETVTLKTSGEIHDGTGLAMTASIVLMMARKFRSPIAAPDAEIALTSRTDLEDPEPIAPADELAESWASSAVERALAAADGKA